MNHKDSYRGKIKIYNYLLESSLKSHRLMVQGA
jgi:hypothetical protein